MIVRTKGSMPTTSATAPATQRSRERCARVRADLDRQQDQAVRDDALFRAKLAAARERDRGRQAAGEQFVRPGIDPGALRMLRALAAIAQLIAGGHRG